MSCEIVVMVRPSAGSAWGNGPEIGIKITWVGTFISNLIDTRKCAIAQDFVMDAMYMDADLLISDINSIAKVS